MRLCSMALKVRRKIPILMKSLQHYGSFPILEFCCYFSFYLTGRMSAEEVNELAARGLESGSVCLFSFSTSKVHSRRLFYL